jgi:hypothetical protein
MVAPTVAQATARARFWLGDSETAGGMVWKDSTELMQEAVEAAYEQAYVDLNRRHSIQVERMGYLVLPAYQSAIRLSQFGLSNVGLIHSIQFRKPATGWPKEVSSATVSGSALRINFASSHNLSSGNWVESYNMTGLTEDANGSYSIVVIDADSIDLLGCLATGTYSSGGRVSFSLEDWSNAIPAARDISMLPSTPQSQLEMFFHTGDYLRIPAISQQIELAIKFGLSPSIDASVTTTSLGIPNSKHYFGLRIAHYCSEARPGSSRTKHNELAKKAESAWGELVNLLTLQRQASTPIFSPQPLIDLPGDLFE